jgi:DNA polymerase-3 subunit gamma/tau
MGEINTMSKALYRKYRSKSLDEVIGQKHITDILSRAILQGQTSHAYLLTGPRGVGKTSVARILAHEINGLKYDEDNTNIDIIEIDAASNNGVEDVRDLREKVQIAPFSADKKIYIIDEVHMLSKPAFNALLKTLEEPPEHVVFILATTNAEKLPATIISRVQRFSFRPISVDDAIKHLSYIAKQENINISDDALRLIALRSDGSFRDSISLLDQLSNLVNSKNNKITVTLIENMLGLAPNDIIDKILEAVENHKVKSIVELLDRTFSDGVNSGVIIAQLTDRIRENISEKPQLLPLLDSLIDVTKSPQPQLKLLSVLGMAAMPKQPIKSAALLAQPHEFSATITELEKQATLENPKDIRNSDKKDSKTKKNTKSFNWDKLIEFTRQNHIALYSVLSKCGHKVEDNDLTIYTNNKFYKNKLDDNRYSSLLHKCILQTGPFELNIHTIPTSIPPSSSQAAAIAVIMGGGEEVSLEAI